MSDLICQKLKLAMSCKIEATENEQTKEINLKVSSEFIKDWIERNYEQAIEQTAGAMGIRIRGFEC
jgi:ribosomal protein S13